MASQLGFAELQIWLLQNGFDRDKVHSCKTKVQLVDQFLGSGRKRRPSLGDKDVSLGSARLKSGAEGWCNQKIAEYNLGFEVRLGYIAIITGWSLLLIFTI